MRLRIGLDGVRKKLVQDEGLFLNGIARVPRMAEKENLRLRAAAIIGQQGKTNMARIKEEALSCQ